MRSSLFLITLALTVVIINVYSFHPSSTLGSSIEEKREEESLRSAQNLLFNEFVYLQEIVSAKPNYRDAYLKLATLAYQLNRQYDTQKFFDLAYTLDPNNPDTLKLKVALQEEKEMKRSIQ